jgi:hypothetical protein
MNSNRNIPSQLPFYEISEKIKASPDKREACVIRIFSYLSKSIWILQELAPKCLHLVAGFHRASPSAALDKKYLIG